MEVLFLLVLLEFALAFHGQSVVFHANVQVLLFHAGDFELQNDLLGVFIDIDSRHKAGSRQGAVSFVHLAERRIHAILQSYDFTKRDPNE